MLTPDLQLHGHKWPAQVHTWFGHPIWVSSEPFQALVVDHRSSFGNDLNPYGFLWKLSARTCFVEETQ